MIIAIMIIAMGLFLVLVGILGIVFWDEWSNILSKH
jgi:hypothetical protein